ncbi:MAG: aminobenzoate oxygenase, partial [Metallosphaera sp.]
MSDIDYLQDPLYPTPNVYPPKWSFDNERAWQLYRRAKREQWDEEDIDWNKIKEIASG